MNDANDREGLFVARCAVLLFVAGPLVPILVLALRWWELQANVTGWFIAFGVIAWFLALVMWGLAASEDDRFIGRCALVLFITGLLVPTLIFGGCSYRHASKALPYIPYIEAFGLTAEVMALLLGCVGRRHLSGKIGMFGAMIPLALAVLVLAFGLCMRLREEQEGDKGKGFEGGERISIEKKVPFEVPADK